MKEGTQHLNVPSHNTAVQGLTVMVPKSMFGSWERRPNNITHSFENRINNYYGLPKADTPLTPLQMKLRASPLVMGQGTPYNVMAAMKEMQSGYPSPMFQLELDEDQHIPPLEEEVDLTGAIEHSRRGSDPAIPNSRTVSPRSVVPNTPLTMTAEDFPDLPKHSTLLDILQSPRRNRTPAGADAATYPSEPLLPRRSKTVEHSQPKRHRHRTSHRRNATFSFQPQDTGKPTQRTKAYTEFRQKFASPKTQMSAQQQDAWAKAEE